jgi:hypothetical protein
MKRLLLAFTLLVSLFARAQNNGNYAAEITTGKRISLITCGPGYQEIYEVFGHTAIRVTDSASHMDIVYNYGTFNGFEESFELKFMRGKLPYYLSVALFSDFMMEYVERHRTVYEQVLHFTPEQQKAFLNYLSWNAEPENRQYKYDFFFDNCATRIRDLYPKTLGNSFKFSPVLPSGSRLTFRDIINRYFYYTLWERFGINILLGSKIDKVMTDSDIMFLPDYLSKGVANSSSAAGVLTGQPVEILPGNSNPPVPVNQPFLLTTVIALLTVAGLTIPRLRLLGRIMTTTLLLVTGLLGCLIIVMWFFTDHQGCSNNFNILWALPTNLFLAFKRPKGIGRYSLVAIGFILITLILHIAGIQRILMLEFLPLLLAMVYIYGTIFKRSGQTAIK